MFSHLSCFSGVTPSLYNSNVIRRASLGSAFQKASFVGSRAEFSFEEGAVVEVFSVILNNSFDDVMSGPGIQAEF